MAHLASPFYVTDVKDPKELIDPAVKGTTGILKSIQKNKCVQAALGGYSSSNSYVSPKIKRVVITSSVAAIMCPISKKPPVT